MVFDYYNLTEQPFGVTTDTRYLYLGATHREALASLLYSVSTGRGFTALIAKPGMGKTTLLFDFLRMVEESTRTVFLCQSWYSPSGFLRSLLADLDLDDSADLVHMHRKLNDCLIAESNAGRQLVLVIDEAQNLRKPVLEIVRMLSNFETPRRKLMHIVLAGQPQLAETLSSPGLSQLRQRISIVARLQPFTVDETQLYIDHRLRVAGYNVAVPLFTKPAVAMIASYSEGIPRNINNICFNAMAIGCVLKQRPIGVDVLKEVLADLDLRPLCPKSPNPLPTDASAPVTSTLEDNRRPTSFLRSWARRLALSGALMAAVASPLLLGNRTDMNSHAVQAENSLQNSATQATVNTVASSVPSELPKPLQVTVPARPSARIVRVGPKETLYRICIKHFGEYNPAILEELLAMNPGLQSSSRIRPGQEIRIPASWNPMRTVLAKGSITGSCF